MNWMRKHSFLSMIMIFSIALITILLLTDEKIEQYEQITIEYGDSLWSLADQYRGKMSKHDWITTVEKANDVKRNQLVAGTTLSIPVEKNSTFIVQKEAEKEAMKVAVNIND